MGAFGPRSPFGPLVADDFVAVGRHRRISAQPVELLRALSACQSGRKAPLQLLRLGQSVRSAAFGADPENRNAPTRFSGSSCAVSRLERSSRSGSPRAAPLAQGAGPFQIVGGNGATLKP
ncbi:hypothetical protein CMI37_07645 [Candidatus Pacearchaeota archaeon]|nr:hypothetical protein [Candidatus Pacearchaeota archaeon]